MTGQLVISLDFELLWGNLDQQNLTACCRNALVGRSAIPKILALFAQHSIHATWATVGMIGGESIDWIHQNTPVVKPEYENNALSAYDHLSDIRSMPRELLFAPEIIEQILKVEGQEIGTHTFSHFYCTEKGATVEAFHQDVEAAVRVFRELFGIDIKSIVLPRNQANVEFINALADIGIQCWRGNAKGYRQERDFLDRICIRALRLLDSYIPVYGNAVWEQNLNSNIPYCINASRFLRPYSQRARIFEPLKIRRIKGEMEVAAKSAKMYHMWWHPHNFGSNTEEMLSQLSEILEFFDGLRKRYSMESKNMIEYTEYLQREGREWH